METLDLVDAEPRAARSLSGSRASCASSTMSSEAGTLGSTASLNSLFAVSEEPEPRSTTSSASSRSRITSPRGPGSGTGKSRRRRSSKGGSAGSDDAKAKQEESIGAVPADPVATDAEVETAQLKSKPESKRTSGQRRRSSDPVDPASRPPSLSSSQSSVPPPVLPDESTEIEPADSKSSSRRGTEASRPRRARRRPSPTTNDLPRLNMQTLPLTTLERLGRGGSASVYRCENIDGFCAAIKLVTVANLSSEEQDDLKSEYLWLENTSHPHIARVLGHDFGPIELRIVMPLYMKTLRDMLDDQRQSDDPQASSTVIGSMMVQVASALGFLHSRDIMHRDIKSENVFVVHRPLKNDRMTLKLGDFGEAVYAPDEIDSEDDSICLKTEPNGLCKNVGTTEFMAPEMIAMKANELGDYTSKVDIWSLGQLLFELLTRDIPYRFDDYSRFDLPAVIAKGTRPKFPKAYKGDKDWDELFMDCTSFDEDMRPSAGEVRKYCQIRLE